MKPEESRAHARGYDEGYNEARAEMLWKFWKRLNGGTKKAAAEWVLERTEKAVEAGRWPEGFNQPGAD